jgi:hypothetical protein
VNFVRSDDHAATHYSFESPTALLAVKNTQNEDVDDEEEEEREKQDISKKIHAHEQTLQFLILPIPPVTFNSLNPCSIPAYPVTFDFCGRPL